MNRRGGDRGRGTEQREERAWISCNIENNKGEDNGGAATRGQQPDGNGNEEETKW